MGSDVFSPYLAMSGTFQARYGLHESLHEVNGINGRTAQV